MRTLYNLLSYLLLPLVFLYFAWRSLREPEYRKGWGQRLGHVWAPKQAIWVHAASVGEVALAQSLVRRLAAAYPHRKIIVTTFTPTGAARVKDKLADVAEHRYVPLDTIGATRRFMRRLQPSCGIIIETELWPQLLRAAAIEEVPVVIANANISPRSAKIYQSFWLRPLIKPAIQSLALIAAAGPEHVQRFSAVGAKQEQLVNIGNLKYDFRPDDNLMMRGQNLRQTWQASKRFIWIAASTHAGEEEKLIQAHQLLLKKSSQNPLLIIAPRHPQRFKQVQNLLEQSGLNYARRSQNERLNSQIQVLLGDTLGDVPLFYALADAAFVAGSLVEGIGGHNVLEAAALHCPVVTGPYIEDWREVIDVMAQHGGLAIIQDIAGLAALLEQWSIDPVHRQHICTLAYKYYQAQQGALDRFFSAFKQAI